MPRDAKSARLVKGPTNGGDPEIYDEPIITAGTEATVLGRSDTDVSGAPLAEPYYSLAFPGFGTSLPGSVLRLVE